MNCFVGTKWRWLFDEPNYLYEARQNFLWWAYNGIQNNVFKGIYNQILLYSMPSANYIATCAV
jgi:hypothetical protein